jgi:hypothetical protein
MEIQIKRAEVQNPFANQFVLKEKFSGVPIFYELERGNLKKNERMNQNAGDANKNDLATPTHTCQE